MPQIKYIKNKDIDFILWDKCISRAQNGDVFGYSWYLDAVYIEWDALIIDDYKAVFPVPVKKIAGIKIIEKPIFLSKLNLYISQNLNVEITSDFFKPLAGKLYSFYSDNKNLTVYSSKLIEKYSYRIDLISPYKSFQKTYSGFFKEQLEIAKKNKLFYNTGILPNGFVLLASVVNKLNKKKQNKLRVLSSLALRKNKGEIFGAFNEKNRLIAAVLFIRSHYKTNIIVAYSSKEAQNKKALYGLIDHYLKIHSEKAITLDFFGLNLMPVEFYKGLGAKQYPYYKIKKSFFF
ncbi:MAG: hypothetical protein L3J35_07080 [Bacteroidales bacterium]|nr:hypothetical protein [Bacteroidales bacterium]